MRRMFFLMSILMALTLVLSGCGGAATPAPEKPAEKPAEQPTAAQPAAEPTKAPAAEQPTAAPATEQAQAEAPAADKKLKIALSLPQMAFPFFVFMEKQVKAEAEKLGNIEIVTLDGQNEVPKQTADLEAVIAQGYDGLLVSPITADAMAPAVQQVVDAKIPVVTIDRSVSGVEVLAHVGADNVKGGEAQGEAILKLFPKGATIFELLGTPGASPAIDRDKGLKNIIGGKAEIKIACEQTANFKRDDGLKVTENCLGTTPNPDAIVAANDDMGLGAIEAAKAANLKAPIISYDALPEALQAIQAGDLYGTVEQFPGEQSKTALRTLVDKLRNGKDPESKTIFITPKLITKDNINEAERIDEIGGAAAPAAAPTGKKPVVGLVMKSLANEFFKIMEEGAVKWASGEGNVDLKPVGMNSETDIDTQYAAVENFVTQQVDLIVVAPADSVGMVAPVKKAIDAGITVVNFDVKLDDKALADVGLKDFLFVGPDNAAGAKLAGDALAQKLGKGGKVFIIEGNPGADNATQRKNGFMQSIEEGGLELLESTTAHWETEEANTVVTNLLTKYPEVQGIMCANDSMVLGAVKAIEAAGKTGQIEVVGFDNIPAVQDLIKQGKVLATVDQFGPDMAKNAIQVGLRVLNGEKLTGWIKTDVKLVTAADLK